MGYQQCRLFWRQPHPKPEAVRITVVLINVVFCALVVAGIVGGLAYTIAADRRHLRILGYRVKSNAATRAPSVAATPQLSGFNA